MHITSANQIGAFAKIDKQNVIGTLKATGSRDPDILYAQKNEMLNGPKQLKMVGMLCLGGGALLTLTIIVAFAGIPIAIFGWWLWSFNKKKIAIIEEAYAEYIANLNASAAGAS
jgi:hypothetical protein